ncbi:hypothetical protein Lal_00035292 [Lupinus albus]|nr:hypothetical protein Lal_00035292 [Lupinus albus]
MPKTNPGAQPTLKSVMQSKEVIEKCDLTISKWMIDASVPFNATNSAYYQPMIDVVCSMGPSYKGPNYYRVRGHLVNKWVEDVKILINDYRSIWKRTGCTLMANVMYVGPENIVTHNATGSILAQKDALTALVTSREWSSSAYSKDVKAKKCVEQVLDSKFWKQCVDIVKITEALVRVLRIVDGEDKPVMGFLYQAFFKARHEMGGDQWWETYGCRTPNLQRLAVRVLSQTCSASGCERKWSESPLFLTVEEIEVLRNDLANISIQPSLDDNDQINLEDDDDAKLNLNENVNLDEDNVGQASGSNDEEMEPQYETTLTHWC